MRSPSKKAELSPVKVVEGAAGLSISKQKSSSPLRQPSLDARKVSPTKMKDLLSPVKLVTGGKYRKIQLIPTSPARAFEGDGKSMLSLRKEYSKDTSERARKGDAIGRSVTYGGEEHGSGDEEYDNLFDGHRLSSRRRKDGYRKRLHANFLKDTRQTLY